MVFHFISTLWDDFFHSRTSQLQAAANIRRAYAFVSFVNVFLLSLDWEPFFRHVLPTKEARKTIDPDTWTIFESDWIPDESIHYFLYLWMVHLILLGFGIYPRIQAFCCFFWINQFMSQNNQLWNGEDNVLRLCAFFLIFWPPYSQNKKDDSKKDNKTGQQNDQQQQQNNQQLTWPMWPFRLMQFQLCLIFFSSGGLKMVGKPWQDGTALYRVTQVDALYGGYFNPDFLFGYTRPLEFITYATVVLELGSIITLWFRETRAPTLISLYLFHFGIDASMNLNTFHWIMMVGWSSFWIQPDDVSKQWSWMGIWNFVKSIVMSLVGRCRRHRHDYRQQGDAVDDQKKTN